MKANELKCTDLRIGNYLKYDDEIIQVSKLCKNYVEFYDKEDLLIGDNPKYFQPIELTEELLCEIGFCFNGVSVCGKSYAKTNGDDTLWCKICVGWDMSLTCNNNANLIQLHKVKYLHQLQNAYYLLTNEELEVEL